MYPVLSSIHIIQGSPYPPVRFIWRRMTALVWSMMICVTRCVSPASVAEVTSLSRVPPPWILPLPCTGMASACCVRCVSPEAGNTRVSHSPGSLSTRCLLATRFLNLNIICVTGCVSPTRLVRDTGVLAPQVTSPGLAALGLVNKL